MEIIIKPSFNRDITIRDKALKKTLESKILQIIRAKDISHITGLKLLKGYSRHYRIKVSTKKKEYRVGAVIRDKKIWLVRFLHRRKIYKKFP